MHRRVQIGGISDRPTEAIDLFIKKMKQGNSVCYYTEETVILSTAPRSAGSYHVQMA
jgi:hypothetical protein